MTEVAGSPRHYDIVLWGATGFTGRLVAAHLVERHGVGGTLRWALAGRDRGRLEALRRSLGDQADGLPILTADAGDARALNDLARTTRLVCAAAGPFARIGSGMVAACVEQGSDYVDISGEAHWIAAMIGTHQKRAAQTGARIIHCCGFDSIPSDLGTRFAQQALRESHGQDPGEIRMRVRRLRGGLSGGTVASMLALIEAAAHDRAVRHTLADPCAFNPPDRRRGPCQRGIRGAARDELSGGWCAPFLMASINTKVVQRSQALTGDPDRPPLRYDEALLTGRGLRGWLRAVTGSAALGLFVATASVAPGRALLRRFVAPKPGEGPDRQARESGGFELLFTAFGDPDRSRRVTVRVSADRDPGYGATGRMLGESALCLAFDDAPRALPGGFWTPATALGDALLERLRRHAGMRFEQVDDGDEAYR